MTSQNKDNSELSPVESVDIDNLLAQVDEMSNRMENLMTSNKLAKKNSPESTSSDNSKSNPPEKSQQSQESNTDQLENILTNDQADDTEDKWEQSDTPAESAGNELDPDPAPEIAIDEHVDSLAEDEINQMLNKLGKRPADFPDETIEEQPIPAVNFPAPIRKFLSVLYIINYPFIWIPASVRDCLGYIAIGTLLFALGLWVVAGIFYKNS